MSRLVAKVLGVHQRIYIASKGYLGHHVPGMAPNLLLTSVGAKSGARRINSLTYAHDGKDLVIVASNGGTAATLPGITTSRPTLTCRFSWAARNAAYTPPPCSRAMPIMNGYGSWLIPTTLATTAHISARRPGPSR